MVDAVYRGNIEELLSVINHLKKYIIVFFIVLLVLVSIFHFSKYSVQVVPLITVTLVLLPAVYYTTVLVLKFSTTILTSNQTGEVPTMNENNNQQVLKMPSVPYPKSPTPPPSYEEATRNDHYRQPQPWLPSTSGGLATIGTVPAPADQSQNNGNASVATITTAPLAVQNCTKDDCTLKQQNTAILQNIPSVTITVDDDQSSVEII